MPTRSGSECGAPAALTKAEFTKASLPEVQRSAPPPAPNLRPFDWRDIPLFVRLYSCPRVMRQIQPAVSVAAAERSATRLLATPQTQRKVHYWVIAYQTRFGWQDAGLAALTMHSAAGDSSAGNSSAGNSSAGNSPAGDSAATWEVGVMLLPQASNKQLGLQACQALVELAFIEWRANIVLINHRAGNLPAARIARQLGMSCLDCHHEIWRWQLDKAAWQAHNGRC